MSQYFSHSYNKATATSAHLYDVIGKPSRKLQTYLARQPGDYFNSSDAVDPRLFEESGCVEICLVNSPTMKIENMGILGGADRDAVCGKTGSDLVTIQTAHALRGLLP